MQTAVVDQKGAAIDSSVSNDLHLKQSAKQTSKTGTLQTQDAFQSATVTQIAKGSGKNLSNVSQSQNQQAQNGSTQKQNASFPVPTGFDCDPTGFPSEPNACANVSQDSELGKNQNNLRQTITEDAKSNVVADQNQGQGNGGLEGRVHQETDSASSQNLNHVKQRKRQTEKAAAGSDQDQFDPVRCCGTFSQEGGSNSREDIDQSAALKASEGPGANQEIDLRGESRTDGTCAIAQHASVEESSGPTRPASETNSASFSPCPLLILETSCTSGIIAEGFDGCTAFPPITGGDRVVVPGLFFLKARP
jgi:hypothetical protein